MFKETNNFKLQIKPCFELHNEYNLYLLLYQTCVVLSFEFNRHTKLEKGWESILVQYHCRDLVDYIFYIGLSWPLFGFIFPFSWYSVRLQLINFTVLYDDRKQERRVCTVHLHIIRKSPTPSNPEPKKPKSIPGFKPGLHRRNTVTLPLAPSPLPR